MVEDFRFLDPMCYVPIQELLAFSLTVCPRELDDAAYLVGRKAQKLLAEQRSDSGQKHRIAGTQETPV